MLRLHLYVWAKPLPYDWAGLEDCGCGPAARAALVNALAAVDLEAHSPAPGCCWEAEDFSHLVSAM